MNIAFVSQPWNRIKPPVESGSIAIWTYQVARRLAPSNRVTVYARGRSRLATAERRQERVTYRYMPTLLDRWLDRAHEMLYRVLGRGRPRFASVFYHVGYALLVALDLRRLRPDVVHIPNLSQFAPIIRALNPKAKIVLHMHCQWLTQLDRALIRRRLRHVDLVIGCCDFITDKVREAFPEAASKCVTVYNGFDPGHFTEARAASGQESAERDELRLLSVGRVSPEKGIHVLLEAFSEVAAEYPQARLDVVGPNADQPVDFIVGVSDEPAVQRLAGFYSQAYLPRLQAMLTPEMEKRVAFTGAIPYSQLSEAYQRADVLVNASLSEAFPMPILEAMACGLPVVATRVGGTQEAVEDEVTGLTVPSDDPAALATAIGRALGDRAFRRKMGTEGRQRAERLFSWDQVAEDMNRAFVELTGEKEAS